MPDWLRLPDEHRDQCIADLDCYKRIGELAKQISTAREQSKAKHLVSLFQSHRYILAFDRHLITLAYIASLIPEAAHREIIVVTGDTSKQARRLQYLLDPDMQGELNSKETAPAEIIGLCSDVLSEGVNLQKASAIVHLDMPTVVVRAEQRLGRSDRINSPHERIESWWPVDGAAFAPRGDEKLFDRLFIVGDVLGANIELPVGLFSNRDDTVTPEIMFQEIRDEEIRREQEAAEDDVFAPIRALIAGEQSIIPENVYTHIRKQPEKIQTSVSIVQSTQAWAFLTVAGENGSPPRMVFFEDIEANPITRLDKVASVLRQRLGPDTENRIFDGDAQDYLSKFADRLSQVERQLLPKRKQRALSEMQIVLTHHVKKASTSQLSEEQTTESSSARIHELMSILLDMLSGKPQKIQRENNERLSPNFNTLSDRWLDLSRPFIQERSEKLKQRRRFVRLKDIRDDLKNTNFSISIIEHLLNPELLWSSPVDERVVAAIIGIPLT